MDEFTKQRNLLDQLDTINLKIKEIDIKIQEEETTDIAPVVYTTQVKGSGSGVHQRGPSAGLKHFADEPSRIAISGSDVPTGRRTYKLGLATPSYGKPGDRLTIKEWLALVETKSKTND